MKKTILILSLALFFSTITQALAGDKNAFKIILSATQTSYIEKVNVEKIAILFLKSLNSVDKNFSVADEKRRITLYYNTRPLKSYPKPNVDDIDSWVNLSFIVIKDAKKVSSLIAARDHDLFDITMAKALDSLGNDSKYYAELSAPDPKSFLYKRIDDVLYIKISEFSQDIKDKIKGAISHANNNFDGIILDLRGNRGGVLVEAIDVIDLFLDEGIITSTYGHEGEDIKFYMSSPGDIINNRPIVVLIDGSSASASEVLASSMQEQGRAKLVGSTTFGKGTVQSLLELPNDSYLAITTARFYTPSGEIIDKTGLFPDYCTVDDTITDMSKIEKNLKECPKQDRAEDGFDIKTAVKIIKENK